MMLAQVLSQYLLITEEMLMPINENMLLEVQNNISVLYRIKKGKTLLHSCLLTKASLLVPKTDYKEEKQAE